MLFTPCLRRFWQLAWWVAATALLAIGLQAQSAARSGRWAHEDSALTPDARVVWGKLPNGVRYALRPHDAVPQAATLQFLVLSGSMDERDDERGLAHFIEHMCFRGTESFSEEAMVDFFQELGIEYGSDVNAITTFDHTAYALDFRDASEELLGRGLDLFRSFADGVLFTPESIDNERGVILSELRGRDSIGARGQLASMQTMFEGLSFPNRTPGGSPESIESLRPEQFRDFYERCYRPDLMVIVAAGDFDPALLEQIITERFGSMKPATRPLPERHTGALAESRGMRADVFRISDVGSVRVTTASVAAEPAGADNKAARVLGQQRSFVQTLLNSRLQMGLMPTPGAEAGYETLLGYEAAMASVMTAAPVWKTHVAALDDTLRSTYQYGFEWSEVQPLRDRNRRMIELLREQLAHSDPHGVCQALLDSIVEHKVFVGRETEINWMGEWLDGLSLAQVNAVYRDLWKLDTMSWHLSGDLPAEFKAGEVLTELGKSRDNDPRQLHPSEREEHHFELKDWGEATEWELVRDLDEVGAKLFKFGNNVRFNFRPSPHEPGVVRMVVRVGPGLLNLPGNEPALKEFGLQTLFSSGTINYGPDDLREIIGEQLLEFDLNVDDYDALTFRGAAQREDLTALLGVATEFLYAPKFGTYVHRNEKMKAAMTRASNSMGMQEGMREFTDYLFEGDARFTWGTMVDYLGLSSVDVRKWLQKPLTEGYVEVTLVGDISEEDALAAVQRTLGQLPTRDVEKVVPRNRKPVKLAARPGFKRIEFVGERHLAMVMGVWPVEGELDTRDRAALYLLSKILELHVREEIRNNLGMAYSPTASFENYDGFPEFGLLRAMIDCSADETTKIARLVEDIAWEISRKGVDEGEFKGARGILSSRIRRAFMDNGFLLEELIRAQERPESVEEMLALKEGLVDEITLEEVDAWAKKVLTRRNSRTAAIVPKQFIGLFETN
ncbi:M16 family metallopeptidase [Actomonas aquatica]|uniref:Insulinase family protein n=1 Tax=Actomonas aquatica TaxID=2866162 RepID=A0ABZ1C847_9BACT|nr:insulinase family protein [Opitutus sp. WL0086]WRQ87854.1 insulinase family protein [Opitutus sp. WL0086]